MATVHLLQSHPHVAEAYRRRFRHVLVDEYQDTNHAQYMLVKELVGPSDGELPPGELCVVGDADQSIYAFRGATIRNILEFERDYPNARTILLEQNYRSTQTILSAANAVIDRNTVAQAQAAVERPGRRRADRRLRRRHRARRGRLGGPRDRPARRQPRGPPRRRGRLLPHQRAVPGLRGGVHPGRPAVQGGRRGALLRAQGGPRRAGLPAGDRQRRRHGEHPPGAEHARAAASATGPRPASRRCPHATGSRSAQALRRAKDAPGISTRAANSIAEFVALLDDLREMSAHRAAGGGPGGGAAALRPTDRAGGEHRPAGPGPGGEPAGAGQRRPRVHRAGRGPGRRDGRRAGAGAPPWPASSSRSRWSPTPTRSPATTRSTRAWSR